MPGALCAESECLHHLDEPALGETCWRLLRFLFEIHLPDRQALGHGVRVSGCTVHLVDAELDSGPIVVQRPVAVAEGDDEAALAARILAEEHLAYPDALRRLLTRRWRVEGRRLIFTPGG